MVTCLCEGLMSSTWAFILISIFYLWETHMKRSISIVIGLILLAGLVWGVMAGRETAVTDRMVFASKVGSDVIITDATTSTIPNVNPDCYIYTGYNAPHATPRSIQIYWPISEPINSATQGTTTFSFWATKTWTGYETDTHILVNGSDIGRVTIPDYYDWVSIEFPTNLLNQGANNTIEIWTNTAYTAQVACDAPSIDDVGEVNAFYIRDNNGTPDKGPRYGQIYAKISVEVATNPSLQINYANGAPGSFFTVTGADFPTDSTASIQVNSLSVGTVPTDAEGRFTFLLTTTNADEGAYFVTTSVDSSATTQFVLNAAEPVRPQEGSGDMFDVPTGIAFNEFVFLPSIVR